MKAQSFMFYLTRDEREALEKLATHFDRHSKSDTLRFLIRNAARSNGLWRERTQETK